MSDDGQAEAEAIKGKVQGEAARDQADGGGPDQRGVRRPRRLHGRNCQARQRLKGPRHRACVNALQA